MEKKFILNAGGVGLELRTSNETVGEFIEHRYGRFLEEKEPLGVLEIKTRKSLKFGSPAHLALKRNGKLISGKTAEASFHWDVDTSSGILETPGIYLYYPVENCLRVILAVLARKTNAALLVHAAAVAGREGGQAVLFPGPSGTGKTTVAEAAMESGGLVIGDDLVFLRYHNEAWIVESSPFAGVESEMPASLSRSLGRICILEKSETTRMEKVSRSRATAALAAAIPFSEVMGPDNSAIVVESAEKTVFSTDVRKAYFMIGSDVSIFWRDLK